MATDGQREIVAENKVATPVKQHILWYNVLTLTTIHVLALCSVFVVIPHTKWLTLPWELAYATIAGFGVTAGVHRYWTHVSYKAKLPLRVILAACFLAAGMNSIFDWVRDHRVHHKFSETDADPHNAKRGLFFSHVGWLMQKKHPEVRRQGRQVDMSDVLADPVVQFEEKYFRPLQILFAFVIPTSVPCLFWNEALVYSFLSNILRWVFSLNVVWSVNSFAHIYGYRPYNRNIYAAENRIVSALALGEGWHNYHHTFPWDYKTSELGNYGMNFTTAVIDIFAFIGWAYDLKQPSEKLVQKVVQHAGDGTHPQWCHVEEEPEETEELLNTNYEIKEVGFNAEGKLKGL